MADTTSQWAVEPVTEIYFGNASGPQAAPPKKASMTLAYLQITLAPFVFFGNLLILVAIRRSKAMKKVTYLFIGQLAVADLLLGVGTCYRFFLIITENLSKYPCMLAQCIVLTVGGVSETGILLLCLESYFSVRYFTNFRHLFTPRLAWGMIVGCWLFWVAMSLLSVILAIPVERAPCYLGGGYYKTWYLVLYASIYFCHLTLVVYFQLGTLLLTRHHLSLMRPSPWTVDKKAVNVIQVLPAPGNATNPPPPSDTQRKRLKRLSNLSKLVGFILVIYFASWTPACCMLIYFATCKKNCAQYGELTVNLASLIVASSLMNVVVYAAKSPEFRSMFRSMLFPYHCSRIVAPAESELSYTRASHSGTLAAKNKHTGTAQIVVTT